MKSLFFYVSLALLCLTWIGCQSGEKCLEELKLTQSKLERNFAEGDSISFTKNFNQFVELEACVEVSNELTILQKAEADAMAKTMHEMHQGLSCRCYEGRLKEVYDAMGDAENLDLDTWRALFVHWEKTTKSAGSNDMKFYTSQCTNADLTSIATMRSTVAAWNGYHEAGQFIEGVESTLKDIISTGEGIFNRLMEEVDKDTE